MPMRTEHKDTFAPGLTKGGPGSGPHPGAGKRGTELTDKANAATRAANAATSAKSPGAEDAHRQAAEAHWKASDHYAKHEEAADEKGKLSQEHLHMSQLHQEVAEQHEARADSHWNGNKGGRAIQQAPNAPVYMGKADSGDLEKGGPGSGPHAKSAAAAEASKTANAVKRPEIGASKEELKAYKDVHGAAARAHVAASIAHTKAGNAKQADKHDVAAYNHRAEQYWGTRHSQRTET